MTLRAALTAAILKPRGLRESYSACIDGISTRQGTHHVAQMFTSVTRPLYRCRRDTVSFVPRSAT